MSYVKYTKTSTFIFPLLGISKSIFTCHVENSFGQVIQSTRFLNCYLLDSDLVNYEFNNDPYVYVVIKNYRDIDFDAFQYKLMALSNYVEDYEKENFLIMVFKIPEKFMNEYTLILKGKYSELSNEVKLLIINHSYFSGKTLTLKHILQKSPKLKEVWENRLKSSDIEKIDLGNQEVWSKIDLAKESFSRKMLKELNTVKKLTPNKTDFI